MMSTVMYVKQANECEAGGEILLTGSRPSDDDGSTERNWPASAGAVEDWAERVMTV